jgi:hypothetical protein
MHNPLAATQYIGHSGLKVQSWKIGFMSKSNDMIWKTKYGRRRIRDEAPTLEEAIVAAQGLSDEIGEQAEIAASLMGLPLDQVRPEILKAAPLRKEVSKTVAFVGSASAPRTIVVERKPSRRVGLTMNRADRPLSRVDGFRSAAR